MYSHFIIFFLYICNKLSIDIDSNKYYFYIYLLYIHMFLEINILQFYVLYFLLEIYRKKFFFSLNIFLTFKYNKICTKIGKNLF